MLRLLQIREGVHLLPSQTHKRALVDGEVLPSPVATRFIYQSVYVVASRTEVYSPIYL